MTRLKSKNIAVLLLLLVMVLTGYNLMNNKVLGYCDTVDDVTCTLNGNELVVSGGTEDAYANLSLANLKTSYIDLHSSDINKITFKGYIKITDTNLSTGFNGNKYLTDISFEDAYLDMTSVTNM